MADILKVTVVEQNGQELEAPTEAQLSIQNIHNENPLLSTAKGADLLEVLQWGRRNSLYKRDFLSENVEVPSGHVMQMHSPKIDGEVVVNGEVYIL